MVKLLVLKATNPAKPQFNQKDKAEVRKGKNTVTLRTKLSGAGPLPARAAVLQQGQHHQLHDTPGRHHKIDQVTCPAVRLPKQTKSDHRRPGIFPGRRFALATVVACAARRRRGAAGDARRPNQTVVSATIFPGTAGSVSSQQVMLSTLNTCGHVRRVRARSRCSRTARTSKPISQPAWTLGTVLTCGLQIPSGDVNAVQVVRFTGAYETPLSNAQIFDTGQYPGTDGALPTIYVDGNEDQTTYVRPPLSPTDANAADSVTQQGDPVSLVVYENQPPLVGHPDPVTRRREPGDDDGAGHARRDRHDGGRDRDPELGVDVQLDGRQLAAAERRRRRSRRSRAGSRRSRFRPTTRPRAPAAPPRSTSPTTRSRARRPSNNPGPGAGDHKKGQPHRAATKLTRWRPAGARRHQQGREQGHAQPRSTPSTHTADDEHARDQHARAEHTLADRTADEPRARPRHRRRRSRRTTVTTPTPPPTPGLTVVTTPTKTPPHPRTHTARSAGRPHSPARPSDWSRVGWSPTCRRCPRPRARSCIRSRRRRRHRRWCTPPAMARARRRGCTRRWRCCSCSVAARCMSGAAAAAVRSTAEDCRHRARRPPAELQ